MAWSKPTTITSWSFSRYSQYKKCPLAAKFAFIDKIQQPQNDAMKRGDAIHKMAEAYVKGVTRALPVELKKFTKLFKDLKARLKKRPETITVEETWAFRKDWSRTVWNDWTGCWVRIKLDVAWVDETTVFVNDYKTGKFNPQFGLDDYLEQLELYAAAALIIYADRGPNLKVIPSLHYLDHGITYPPEGEEKVYTPKDLPALKKQWEKRTKPMLNDKTFAPKPNRLCGWCFYGQDGKAKGGPGLCKF